MITNLKAVFLTKRKRGTLLKNTFKIRHPIRLTLLCLFVIFPLFLIGSLAVNGYKTFMPTFNSLLEEGNKLIESIDENTFTKREDTQIYDCNGELISEINVTNYQYVPISDISPYLVDGYVAVEDRNFYEHHGVDPKAIARVAVSLVLNRGKITQGGSTITQQVIKNNLISNKSTIERKIIEILIAGKLEDKLSKDQIMEAYCNTNYYANNCFGVETASLYYYGKHANELTLGEAATLIGISNLPARYDPKAHPEAALEKRNFVLNIMLNEKAITVPEYMMARREVPHYVFQRDQRTQENYLTSYAIHCATECLMKEQGFEFQYTFKTKEEYDKYHDEYSAIYSNISSDIRLGGYKIYTSLNPILQAELQKDLDQALSPYQQRGEDGFYELQGAAVTVDNRTGYVVAIVGGREGKGEFNRGYQAIRQPGSAIKPLIVYTPAFETGNYYPSKVMEDKYIKNGPGNAYSGYKGKMSLYEALARSTNTIAYQIFLNIGANYGASYLADMEFSHMSYQDQNNGSLALGGFTYGVSVDEMARGYATLVNQGNFSEKTCIKEIQYRNSGTIYTASEDSNSVFLPDTAYMTIDMMKGVLTEPYGTGHTKSLSNAIAAAKTGTTDEGKDVWFCGSTVYYSTAVWVGYDTPKGHQGLSSSYPGKVWQSFMNYLHKDLPITDFVRPETIVEHPIHSNGDPTSRYSYRTGIFSSVIENKEKAEQAAKEEKEKQEREADRKKAGDNALSWLENKTLQSYDQIPEIEKKIAEIRSEIEKFEVESNKEDYRSKLDLTVNELYHEGSLKYDPGTVFFISPSSEQGTRSIITSFLNSKSEAAKIWDEVEQRIAQLESIQTITEDNAEAIGDLLSDTKDFLLQAQEDIDVSAFMGRFGREQERIDDLLVSYLLAHPDTDPLDVLTQEQDEDKSQEPPIPTPSVSPEMQTQVEDEPGKITEAKLMIDFLKTISPNDERATEYVKDAEAAVNACKNMAEYPYILQAFQEQSNRLLPD